MKRRAFLKTVGTAAGAAALAPRALFAAADQPGRQLYAHSSGLSRRVLGRTGRQVSIIVFPGIALSRVDQPEANAAVRWALDAGVNYFDVAPAYGDAELKMGPALEGVTRGDYFLSCKTNKRDAAGARTELDRSLQRLKTDHFDLYQLHAVQTADEARRALGPGGALETVLAAQKAGKIRWIGFSSHSIAAALALMKEVKFDTVMHPVNFIEHFADDFHRPVLDRAREIGAVGIAIKPMCAGSWGSAPRTINNWYRPLEDSAEIDLALRFSLSIDPVVTAVPPGFVELFKKAVAAAKKYRPATDADVEALRTLAAKYRPMFAGRARMAVRVDEKGYHAAAV